MSRRGLLLNAWLSFLLCLGIAVVVALLVQGHPMRLDLSPGKQHTLSPVTLELLKELPGPVSLRAFITEDLPEPYRTRARALTDLLHSYRDAAGGKLELRIEDPGDDQDMRVESNRLGVPPQQLSARGQSSLELRMIYLGVSIVYQDRQEALPLIEKVDDLEFRLTRALRDAVYVEDKKVLGFLVGHGEPNLPAAQEGRGALAGVKKVLGESYSLKAVDTTREAIIPDDINALIVSAPRIPLSSSEVFALDQFVMRGGALALFVLGNVPDDKGLQIKPLRSRLEPMLAAWGIGIQPRLIVDRQRNAQMPLPVRRGQLVMQVPVNHPLLPLVGDIREDSEALKGVDGFVAPFARPMNVSGEGVTVEARTGAASASVVKDFYLLNPNTWAEPGEDEQPGPFPVVVTVSGPLDSSWLGRTPPVADEGDILGSELPAGELPTVLEHTDASRLFVASCGDFLGSSPNLLGQLADWLVQDDTLLAIRPRDTTPPLLKTVEPNTLRWIRLSNLLGIPLLCIVWGWWGMRRRRT